MAGSTHLSNRIPSPPPLFSSISGPGLCQWLIKSIPSKIKQIQFQMILYIPWTARLESHSKPAYLGPKCLTFYFPRLTCNHDLHPPETTGRSFLQFHLSVQVRMYFCSNTGWEPYHGNHPSPYHAGSGEHGLYFQYSGQISFSLIQQFWL